MYSSMYRYLGSLDLWVQIAIGTTLASRASLIRPCSTGIEMHISGRTDDAMHGSRVVHVFVQHAHWSVPSHSGGP